MTVVPRTQETFFSLTFRSAGRGEERRSRSRSEKNSDTGDAASSLSDRAAGDDRSGQNIYTVVKGDTLWGIAKRFTGNPLNYPRVARDNSIATPDLIFPGQRIRLVQEKR